MITSATKSQNTEVKGRTSGSYGFGLFSGSGGVDTKHNWSRNDYVNQRMEDIKRQVHDTNVRMSGSVRVLTGIRFSQSGTVQNVSFTSIEQSIGTFTLGDATILNTRSVQEYAALLSTAQQVEALLVPQVLVGVGTVVGSEGWHELPGEWAIFRDVGITFPKPFASPPSVVTALNIINNGSFLELVFVDAENITSTGFTMHFGAHPNSRYHWARASWIATGAGQHDYQRPRLPRHSRPASVDSRRSTPSRAHPAVAIRPATGRRHIPRLLQRHPRPHLPSRVLHHPALGRLDAPRHRSRRRLPRRFRTVRHHDRSIAIFPHFDAIGR